MKNLIAVGTKIVVRADKANERTEAGLYLPNLSKEKPVCGTVISVGPGDYQNKPPVKEGAPIMYGKYAGTEVECDGESLLVIDFADVLCVVVEKK